MAYIYRTRSLLLAQNILPLASFKGFFVPYSSSPKFHLTILYQIISINYLSIFDKCFSIYCLKWFSLKYFILKQRALFLTSPAVVEFALAAGCTYSNLLYVAVCTGQ